MGKSCNLEVVKGLGIMFVRKRLYCLQLNNKHPFHNKISKVIPKTIPIGIMNPQRFLRFNRESRFLKPMFKAILIHLLKITIAKVNMQIIRNLPHLLN